MQTVLSGTMDIPENTVSIKATTTEKLGFTGREEGIAVYAVALIQKSVI
jgi:2-C-methyl-D-erythritol 2,4-cyclodiphosphate synthase